jgi:hypothetical protein
LTTLCGLTLGLVLQVLVVAWFALVQVKNKREGLSLAGPPRSGETSRLSSRDPVADGIKCEPHGARRARRSFGHRAGASVVAKSRNEARLSRPSGRRR